MNSHFDAVTKEKFKQTFNALETTYQVTNEVLSKWQCLWLF
ncbi:protein of unknown function [Shewanella benthica]|uniref:Uncharacterized protein n=1 Tax=Shewanella benthica TaxID=43661 RepID=A0A330M806_9GAMM|nr:protein of unknown function [Shewanella benthica]